MNINHLFKTSCVVLALSSHAFAGSDEVAAVSDSHQPWTLEASLLYMYAEGQGTNAHYYGQDHEVGYRFNLGYQPTAESWGYSLTYTQFQGTQSGTSEPGPEFSIYDLVATKDTSFRGFDYSYFLGIRFMDLEEPYSGSFDVDYSGFGPIVGVYASQELSNGFSLYANTGISYLFGDDKEEYVPDETYTWQIGVGVQYDISENAYVKLGYEYQHYEKMAYTSDNFSVDGFVLSVGYKF